MSEGQEELGAVEIVRRFDEQENVRLAIRIGDTEVDPQELYNQIAAFLRARPMNN